MRGKCVVYGCTSATYNSLGYLLSFHKFPRDPARARKWMRACKNPKIKSQKVRTICSQHFERRMYHNSILRVDAYPTLNLPEKAFSYRKKEQVTNTDNTDYKSSTDATHNNNVELKEHTESKSQIAYLNQGSLTEDHGISEQIGYSDSEDILAPDSPAESNYSIATNPRTDTKDTSLRDPICGKCGDVSENDLDIELQLDSEYSNDTEVIRTPPEPEPQSMPSISKVLDTKTSAIINRVIEESYEKQQMDDCSTFAAHLKTRMKNFDPHQKIIAMKLISDVMFMADTRQLQVGSTIVNPDPDNIRLSDLITNDAHDEAMPKAKRKK